MELCKYKLASIDPSELTFAERTKLYEHLRKRAFSNNRTQFDKPWARIAFRLWEYEKACLDEAERVLGQTEDIARILYGTVPDTVLSTRQDKSPSDVLQQAIGFLENSRAVQQHRSRHEAEFGGLSDAARQVQVMNFFAAHSMYSASAHLCDFWHLNDNPPIPEMADKPATITFTHPLWIPDIERIRNDLTDIGCDIKCVVDRETSTLHKLMIPVVKDYTNEHWRKIIAKMHRRLQALEPIS